MADAFTFDPNITITPDHQLVLTGTVDPAVRNLQIYDQTGGVLDLSVKPDGSWSGAESFDPNTTTTYGYKAEYNDGSGQPQIVHDTVATYVGLKGYPFASEEADFKNPQDIPLRFYSSDGSLNSNIDLNETKHTLTETGDHLHAKFVFYPTSDTPGETEAVANFHLGSKYSHDTLILPHQDFSNMAELLRETDMSGGNAVIHDHDGTATLTLMGITKDEMKAHSSDFSFTGSKHLIV